MKRGVSFIIPNKYGSLIYDILKPVCIESYNWFIGADQINIVENNCLSNNTLFEQQIIDGCHFYHKIKDNVYYVIFTELKAFPKDDDIDEIVSYDDFIKSKCEIIVLISDCCFVDIYCKDDNLIKKIFENAKIQGYENISYINDKNDSRNRMYVF